MRRHRALALLLGAALLLAACVPGGAPVEPATSTVAPAIIAPAESAAPLAAPPDAAGTSGGRVTITFAALGDDRQLYKPLIENFEIANPGIHVQYVPIEGLIQPVTLSDGTVMYSPYTSMRAIVGGADTAVSAATAAAIQQGWVHDLKPLMDSDPTFDPSDFYTGTLDVASREDKIYMLPKTQYVATLAYNKALWAASGMPAPRPDWSWADVKAAAEQLARRRGGTVEVYGLMEWRPGEQTLRDELKAAGVDLAATPIDRLRLDDPAIETALEHVADMARSGALYMPADGNRYDPGANAKLVRGQQVGIWMPGLDFLDQSRPPFEVGTASSPFDSVVVDGYIMSAGTQHPQQAWRWLSYLSRQILDPTPGYVSQGVEVPARRSIAERSHSWERLDPETLAAVQAMLARPTALPRIGEDNRALELLTQALNAVVINLQPVRQALRDAQAALDQHVAELQLTPRPTPGEVIAVATPLPEAPPQATTITFGAPRFIADQLGAAARAFNQANPEIFVKIEPDDAPGAPSRLADAAALSDCFVWPDAPRADDFATLLDLQPLIDADAGFQAGDYPPPLLAPFKHEAGLYGLPSMVSFRALHYNASTFDAAGVARPTTAWTLDDLLNAARRLTSGSGTARRYGFGGYNAQTGEVFFFLDHLGAAPATGRGETIKPNFTDPRVVQAISSYLDLLRAASPNTRLQGYRRDDLRDDAYDAIAAGRVGMWFAFGDRFLDRGPGLLPDFAWAIAPPPLGDSAVTPNDFRVQGMYISAKTLHAAACWSWLKQLSADPTITQGGFPARRSLAESSALLDQAPPGAAAVYRAYLAAFDRPPAPDSPDELFSQSAIDYYWLFRAIDRVLHGGNLERQLADAQALTEQYLACVRGGAAGSVCAVQVDPDYQGLQRAVAGSR